MSLNTLTFYVYSLFLLENLSFVFSLIFALKFVFPFLVRSYKDLQKSVYKKPFAALYFITKSKSAQNIFHLLTLLLLTICVALDFSNSSTKSPSLQSSHVKNGFKKIVLFYITKLMIV